MLRLFEHDSVSFETGQTATLNDSVNIQVSYEINGNRTLKFDYPMSDEKAALIKENMIVVCEGQAYRIMKLNRSFKGECFLNAQCCHVYNADAPKIHIQNLPDMIGCTPTEIIKRAFSSSPFTFFTDSELEQRGMVRVDYDGFKIDFFSEDKTNPYDVMTAVIKNCGKGEVFADNYKIALVERIGKDNGLRLRLGKNMSNLSVERDITNLVTRLYPYGSNDAHIGSVNGGKQYIESANADVYGIREGFADYSDYVSPEKILNRARWEFDSENADRIDVPDINISGDIIDLSRLAEYGDFEKLSIGDTVIVADGDELIRERIIKIKRYPMEPRQTEVSIGRIKKDLFFYLDQMGTLSKRYRKISTGSGKVRAMSIAGNVNVEGIGINSNRDREFSGAVDAPYLTVAGIKINEQNGELYINGKKILVEEVVVE